MAIGQVTKGRKATTLQAFSSFGDIQRAELKGSLPIRAILLDLSLTISNTGGTTNGTTPQDAPHSYLGPVIVTEDGGRQLYALSGAEGADVEQTLNGVRPSGSAFSGTGAAITANAQLQIPFSLPRFTTGNPDDTVYMAAGKILTIEARLGGAKTSGAAGGGIFHSDNDRAVVFGSGSVAVEVDEVRGMNAGPVKGHLLPLFTYFRQAAIATTTRLQQKLNTGTAYRMLWAKYVAEVVAAGGSFEGSNAILNNLSVETGQDTLFLSTARQLASRLKLRMQAETQRAGLYGWDFAGLPQQNLESFDTSGVGDFSTFADVSAVGGGKQTDQVIVTQELVALQ